jgi:endonuclease/exonuclease/phosphatase family metal-dependent hydrolase
MDLFRLLTLNVFGAAQDATSFFRWRGVPAAARLSHPKLIELAASVDIACFQEVFLREAEEFFDSLPHAQKHRDTNETDWRSLTFGGSGLGIATRFPRLGGGVFRYSPPHERTERFARKGMLHATLDVSGHRLDVITTHMQSGIEESDRRVRERQIDELASVVARVVADGAACIVCGDLNIDGLLESSAEFGRLRRALDGFEDLGGPEGVPTFVPRREANPLAHLNDQDHPIVRIDYVWFRPPRSGAIQARGPVEVLCEALDESTDPPLHASDHFGLLATFEMTKTA